MVDHGWVLGVLNDLSKYAKLNGLTKTEEIIFDAGIIAFSEISRAHEQANSSIVQKTPAPIQPNSRSPSSNLGNGQPHYRGVSNDRGTTIHLETLRCGSGS
jgi:hypothetical protein